jgi:hypothetical protein
VAEAIVLRPLLAPTAAPPQTRHKPATLVRTIRAFAIVSQSVSWASKSAGT